MTSADPARDGHIELADGRRLAYAEWGDLDGRPLVLLHGSPGSRLICPDVAATTAAGVRLITYDRAGVGGSDPRAPHDLSAAAGDLVELADALALPTLGVIGWSGGGPFALAAAVRHPDRVTSVTLVSASGTPDDPELVAQRTPETDGVVEALRAGSPGAQEAVEARYQMYADDPTFIIDLTLDNEDDPDREVMRRPAVATALATMWQEGARQGATGCALDWTAQWALPWGFTPAEVTQRVTSWHGTHDVIVPVGLAQRLAARLPQPDLRLYEGEGHLIAIDHWAEILERT